MLFTVGVLSWLSMTKQILQLFTVGALPWLLMGAICAPLWTFPGPFSDLETPWSRFWVWGLKCQNSRKLASGSFLPHLFGFGAATVSNFLFGGSLVPFSGLGAVNDQT